MNRMSPHDTGAHSRDGSSVSQRLAAALGRPAPQPLSDVERAELERLQDDADRGADLLYGVRGQAA
jgi:hypothetical protein